MNALKHGMFNGWPFFYLIAGLTFAGMVAGWGLIGTATPEATVELIRLSVQFASPWIFIAFVTSPLQQLFPVAYQNGLLATAVTRAYLSLLGSVGKRYASLRYLHCTLPITGSNYTTRST
jgi:hypothetical protein